MRVYSVRTHSSAEPISIEAVNVNNYSSNDLVEFYMITELRESITVASFKRSDIISITSKPKSSK